jgi:uncharacterized protein YndB with AHSA1/START domain
MTDATDRTDPADRAIEREVVVDAPVEVVWRTITEPDQIALWFAHRVDLDLRPGGHGALELGDRAASRTTTVALVVEAVEPPHRFAFRWGHPEGVAPVVGNSLLVEFTLIRQGADRTLVRVVETGLAETGWPDERQAG